MHVTHPQHGSSASEVKISAQTISVRYDSVEYRLVNCSHISPEITFHSTDLLGRTQLLSSGMWHVACVCMECGELNDKIHMRTIPNISHIQYCISRHSSLPRTPNAMKQKSQNKKMNIFDSRMTNAMRSVYYRFGSVTFIN